MPAVEKHVEWWTKQAAHDLEVARSNRASGFHDTCVLYCQQSSEKYLKALFMQRQQATPPKTHKCDQLAVLLGAPSAVVSASGLLENDYMACRYPDAAGGVPFERFDDSVSQSRILAAEEVQQWVLGQLAPTPESESTTQK